MFYNFFLFKRSKSLVEDDIFPETHCARKRVREGNEKDVTNCNGDVQDIKEFPNRGGANGSIRFYPEIDHGANAGYTCSPSTSLIDVMLRTRCIK